MSDLPPIAGRGTGESDATITPLHGTPVVADLGAGVAGQRPVIGEEDGASGPLEAHLLEALDGDAGRDGLTALYLEHHDRLVRLAYVLTGSREIAEDVVQDSFVRLYNRWGAAEHPDRYIRQIVVNECRSHHRRSGRERDRRAKLYVVDSTHDRHGVELEDLLMDLPYRQRAAIVLRFYSDLSEAEIADVLGCRPGTVGSLIHRGLERLRKAIDE